MKVGESREFLCPYCAGINVFYTGERNGLKEVLVSCDHCKKPINVIAASGIDDAVNVVAVEYDEALSGR